MHAEGRQSRAIIERARAEAAAAFRFALDDTGVAPRVLEHLVAARASLAKLPFGDQGLLISRRLYSGIGGFAPLPIMEDVDLVRRLGPAHIAILKSRAVTSAARYRSEGYLRRTLRNQRCLAMYLAGASSERIASVYNGGAQ